MLAAFAAWHYPDTTSTAPLSAEIAAQGRQVNVDQCASCHGAALEGQPDWKSPLPSGRLPAPPHDVSGRTWHHPVDVLFRIIQDGMVAFVGNGYESDMPGFGDVLSDAEIWAVLTYIKSKWPERERNYQQSVSQRNRESWHICLFTFQSADEIHLRPQICTRRSVSAKPFAIKPTGQC